jgi:hypothetical protein
MKIGRNKFCPCGSGKKYKKCCLNKSVTGPETPNRLTAEEICSRFGVKKTTVSSKVSVILGSLDYFRTEIPL